MRSPETTFKSFSREGECTGMFKKGDHVRILPGASTAYGRRAGATDSGTTAWLRIHAGDDAIIASDGKNRAGEVMITCTDRQQRPVLEDFLELVPEGHRDYLPTWQHHRDIIIFANFLRQRLPEEEYRAAWAELEGLHISLPPYIPYFAFQKDDVVYTPSGDKYTRDEWGGWRPSGRPGKRRILDDEELLRAWRGHPKWRLLLRKGVLYEGEQPFEN